MDQKRAIAALRALAQESRLELFRLLVTCGPEGLPAGVIAEKLGVMPSSLSFHLQQLARGTGAVTSIATAARRHALSGPVVREAFIELVATAFLLIAVVGSAIMAERLCGGNVGLALLANAIATGGALVALILAFGPQSGAHMNPVVTLAAAATEGLRWHTAPAYIAAQIVGAILGVWLGHIMFDLPIWQISQHARTGLPQWVAEVIATFGLLTVIWAVARTTSR